MKNHGRITENIHNKKSWKNAEKLHKILIKITYFHLQKGQINHENHGKIRENHGKITEKSWKNILSDSWTPWSCYMQMTW